MENFQQRKFQIYHMEDNYLQKIPHRYEVELLNIKKDFLYNLYSNFEFRYTSICREKTDLKIFETNLLDYLQKFKFIIINVHNLGQKSKIDNEDLNSLRVDVTICVEKQCIIIVQIDLSIISHIFNVLKEQGIKIIDTTNESILTEETILENQVKEEIRNVCMCYLQDINQNYFMEITISAIVGYTIRRFFCPTEYFKDPSFFDFEGDCINERIIKEKFDELLKSKDFNVKKFSEIKQLAETKDINKSQHEFKVKDFIKLREIISDENKSIYLALHLKSLHVFAMKIFTKKDELTKDAKHEIDFVQNYSHRCIVHFYGFIKVDKTGKIIGLIYEFMSNGSLRPNVHSNLEKINEVFVLNTIIRILLGIDYLHSNKLIHRDLKPSNILIDHDFLPYISDFETILSTEDEDANLTDDIGSPLYTSPEQERGERLTSATDIYSFGLIIYYLFNKKDMFGNCGSFFFMKKINDKIYELACGSKNLERIYSDCVQFNQEKRISAKEIKDDLHDEFFTFIVRNSFLNSEKSQKKQFIFENFLIQENFENYIDLLYILCRDEGKCDYDDALVKNNLNILNLLGDAYFYGHDVKRDYLKAKEYYELLADRGNSDGMAKLGRIYYKGKGLDKDLVKALDCYTSAVKLNNSNAFIGLAKIYLKNADSENSNFQKAIKYFEQSCEFSYLDSLKYLWKINIENEGSEKNNFQKAIYLFEQSCELGNSYGFYYLGKLYYEGKYVNQNYEKAKKIFEESFNCNSNNSDICNLLGLMYKHGLGVKEDIKKAREYFKKSIEINLPGKILIDSDKKKLQYFDQIDVQSISSKDYELKDQQENYNQKIAEPQKIEELGSETISSFKTIAKIHSGGFKDVYEVVKHNNYALKIVYNIENIELFQSYIHAIEILSQLSHPNIVKSIGYFLGDETIQPSILLEFCPMNIDQLIRENAVSNVDIAFIVYQIAEGMRYAHSKKIIHCNLMPSNILLGKDGLVKISNFGILKLIDVECYAITAGIASLHFMAPELIEEEPYDEKIDVYSFGTILYYILYKGSLPNIRIRDILNAKIPSIPNNVSSISKTIITKCWNYISNDCPSFDDIAKYLEDQNYNIIDLTESEIIEVKNKIKEHKKIIASYTNQLSV